MVRFLLTILALLPFAAGQKLVADEELAQSEERAASLILLTKTMDGFTITAGTDPTAELQLVKTPVLRYSDPVSTGFAKISDGAVFVWTRDGCPEAVTALHNTNPVRLWGEFLSLSPGSLTAMRMGQSVWRPAKNGVEFKLVESAPLPENTASQRLAQMRMIVRSFTASVTDSASDRQELRLLPQPAFRYSQPDRGIVDGAIFVFARSTNPEMLLLLEAQAVNGKQRWMYSPARFTGREAELRFADKPVWSHTAMLTMEERIPTEAFFQTYVVPEK